VVPKRKVDVDRPPDLQDLATDADLRAALDGAGGGGSVAGVTQEHVSQSMATILDSSRQ